SGRATILADLGAFYVVPPAGETAGAAAFIDALRKAGVSLTRVDETPTRAEAHFVLAPDPASEAREVARDVVEALAGGLGLHDVAVSHGADRAYSRLICEALAAAAIPAAPLPGTSLVDTPAGRAILGLAGLADADYARAAVFDFLGVAPLRNRLPGS